ncbi:MAG: hypothetical protein ACRCYO_17010 [Bacteroidia bacterium]
MAAKKSWTLALVLLEDWPKFTAMDHNLLLSKKITHSLFVIGYYNPNRFMPSRVHPVATDGELFYAFYPDGRYTLMKTFDESNLSPDRFIREHGHRVLYSDSSVYMCWKSGLVEAADLDSTIVSCKKFIGSTLDVIEKEIAEHYLNQLLQAQLSQKVRSSRSSRLGVYGQVKSSINQWLLQEEAAVYGRVDGKKQEKLAKKSLKKSSSVKKGSSIPSKEKVGKQAIAASEKSSPPRKKKTTKKSTLPKKKRS